MLLFICLRENKRHVYPFEGQKIASVKGARMQEWGLYDIRSCGCLPFH